MSAGFCGCGCGKLAPIAPKTSARRGWVKGRPVRFVLGHGNVKAPAGAFAAANEFCACGCGLRPTVSPSTHRAHGRMYAVRFLVGHNARIQNPGHRIDTETGCWVWLGYVSKRTGYSGMMQHNGRPEIAHRAYYKKYRAEIPDGYELDHICRNRRCVNPDHLEPVPSVKNVRRQPVVKLTEALADRARQMVRDGATRKDVAAQLGVSRSLVSMIASGKRWA